MAALIEALANHTATTANSSGRPRVLVDAIALARGYVAAGETCEIPGVGPVDVEWARRLMGNTVFDVIVHNGVDILTYASSTRHVPQPLKLALAVRDRGCAKPGCHHDQHLERDHTDNFADSHDTSYPNLRRICPEDHDAKTHHGARLERHHNQWWWYPPPDPNQPDQPPPTPIRGPVGQHLTAWNLDHLPDDPDRATDQPSLPSGQPGLPDSPNAPDGPDRHRTDERAPQAARPPNDSPRSNDPDPPRLDFGSAA